MRTPTQSREEEFVDHIEYIKFLKEQLNYERERTEYFERLLLTRAGIIQPVVDVDAEENFPSVRRFNTMSSIRRMATEIRIDQAKKQQEERKTEAEAIFEEELAKNG